MTRHPVISSMLLGTALVVGVTSGCTVVLDLPKPITAYSWCLDAEPAEGVSTGENTPVPITHPASGVWMRACRCYCPADHQVMIQGANGWLALGSPDALWYEQQVAQLRTLAAIACTDRVAELQAELGVILNFVHPQTVSCEDAVADEEPYYANECVLDDDICPPGADGGFDSDGSAPATGTAADTGTTTMADTTADDTGLPGTGGATAADESSDDGGAGVYGLDDWSLVIDCPTPARCDVEAAFVEELLSDLSVLSDDFIGARPGVSRLGHHGFVLARLGADSFPAALGFEPGDVLWRVNGLELRALADVGRAFETLHQATELTAEVDRGAKTLVRTFRIVERVSAP